MSSNDKKTGVMIAGIGGASLGTEIYKSLALAGNYRIYGCDIADTAYGLYEEGFTRTWRVSSDDYVASVLSACQAAQVGYLIPGGEQPMSLLAAASATFEDAGVVLLGNSPQVIGVHSDKEQTFQSLAHKNIPIPKTVVVKRMEDLEQVGLPCIVKPATGSGGSAGVFFAVTADEAMLYANFIQRSDSQAVAQEYIDDSEGEFTIGVLSLPDGQLVGSVAMRRALQSKLSVAYRGRGGLISSGYSQGYIDEFPDLCRQAERVAEAIGSRGPINVQGRVRDGVLLPFEINPRFSASTYLRAMAGFNEIDILIRHLEGAATPTPMPTPSPAALKPGWYLRSLAEQYVPAGDIK
jgi:carbamoyl-phosphate synthase large subunit